MTDSDWAQLNALMEHVGVLAVLAVIAFAAYRISLSRHPWGRKCRKCNGTGQQRGLIFRYSYRHCTRCGGSKERARLGVRYGHRGSQTWGEEAAGAARERRARNFGR